MAVCTSSFTGYNGKGQWRQIDKPSNNKARRAVYPCSKEPNRSSGKHFSTICRVNFLLLPVDGVHVRSFHESRPTDRPPLSPLIVGANCRWTGKIISPIVESRLGEMMLFLSLEEGVCRMGISSVFIVGGFRGINGICPFWYRLLCWNEIRCEMWQ